MSCPQSRCRWRKCRCRKCRWRKCRCRRKCRHRKRTLETAAGETAEAAAPAAETPPPPSLEAAIDLASLISQAMSSDEPPPQPAVELLPAPVGDSPVESSSEADAPLSHSETNSTETAASAESPAVSAQSPVVPTEAPALPTDIPAAATDAAAPPPARRATKVGQTAGQGGDAKEAGVEEEKNRRKEDQGFSGLL